SDRVLTRDPLIGRLIAGKFRVEQLIGLGGMGRVYRAEQINLAKPVALKVLQANLTNDEHLVARFHREAKSASMLAHPHILQVIDFGQDDGIAYLAMELLDGRDLERVIADERPLHERRIAIIGGQILAALDEAHAKNVIHRDLKPSNVMLVDVRGDRD